MKKIYGLIGLGMLTFVLFFSMVSAVIINPESVTLNPQTNETTFVITSDYVANFTLLNNTPIILSDNHGDEIILTITSIKEEDNVSNVTYKVKATGAINRFDFSNSDFEFRKFLIKNYTDASINKTKTIKFIFENINFCEDVLNEGKLDVKIKEVKIEEGYGEKDEDGFWYLRDIIEIEVKVDNQGSWDIDDIKIEWELYTTAGDLIDDGEEDKFDLKENKDNEITFTFKLDKDIEDFEGEYAVLYVKATGEIDADSSDPEDGKDTCGGDNTKEIEVITNKDFVIVDNIKINDESAKTDEYNTLDCEKEVTVSFEVWNIGDDEEEDLYVEVYSKNLEVYEKFEITSINEFDSSEVFEFKFTVPADLDEGKYNLEFEVYDDDNDIYEDDEEDESRTIIRFENEESCLIVQPYVTATLDSEAKEGNDMIIKVIVRNDDVQSRTFSISAEDYSDWAKLKDVSSESFILESGQNQEILITFEIKDEIVGNKDFNLNIFSDGKLISTQPVAVTIEAKKGLSDLFDDVNWKLVGIILVNLALLIAIIVVVRKILKKK